MGCGGSKEANSRGAPVQIPDGGIAGGKKEEKKKVMFDPDTKDDNEDSGEDNFAAMLAKRDEMARKQTYADDDDAMFRNRTDTIHKKNVMTDE